MERVVAVCAGDARRHRLKTAPAPLWPIVMWDRMNQVDKDFYLSVMSRAGDKARMLLRVEWGLVAAACVCAVL
ncbi:hypothetical protein [Rhodococcus koreensis]|uniref:hypothetical protein n=1 Tax=Rhodococcus koreensis TaxID=99653 RepID=UPI00366A6CC9